MLSTTYNYISSTIIRRRMCDFLDRGLWGLPIRSGLLKCSLKIRIQRTFCTSILLKSIVFPILKCRPIRAREKVRLAVGFWKAICWKQSSHCRPICSITRAYKRMCGFSPKISVKSAVARCSSSTWTSSVLSCARQSAIKRTKLRLKTERLLPIVTPILRRT